MPTQIDDKLALTRITSVDSICANSDASGCLTLGQSAATNIKPVVGLTVTRRDKTTTEIGSTHGDRSGTICHHDTQAVPVDAVSDPVLADLEEALRKRSGGTMIAAFRDLWMMVIRHHSNLVYDDALRLLANCGKYRLSAGIGEPMMVRPVALEEARKHG